jgi:CheY-like chemotaxis protein
MPVLDGLATTEAIRQLDGPASQIKVILVTADVVNDTRKRALEVGVNEFTSKPLQAQDLQGALARCDLLEEPSHSSLSLMLRSSGGSPMSAYEMPVRLPDLTDHKSDLIDTDAYAEIVSMMPADSLDELLKAVFEPPDGSVHVLLQAVANGDREAMGYNAHMLKGAAMLMGFRALVKSSAQLEQWAAQADQPVHISLGAQLRHDAEQTQKTLRLLTPSVEA